MFIVLRNDDFENQEKGWKELTLVVKNDCSLSVRHLM